MQNLTVTTAPEPLTRTDLADRVVGFRIMRETEIAPGWWGRAVEVGETGSGSVAHQFCMEQNRVTMQLNRPKMIQYYAEPIYAEPEPMSAADVAAHDLASYVRPARRLVAAGVKRGTGPLVVEQPQPVDFASVR